MKHLAIGLTIVAVSCAILFYSYKMNQQADLPGRPFACSLTLIWVSLQDGEIREGGSVQYEGVDCDDAGVPATFRADGVGGREIVTLATLGRPGSALRRMLTVTEAPKLIR